MHICCAGQPGWQARRGADSGARWSGYLALERLGGAVDWIEGEWDASEQCAGFHGDTVLQCLQPPIACPTSPPHPSIPPQAHCVLPLLM